MDKRRVSVTDEQIKMSYQRTNSVFKSAVELNIGASTVHRRLTALGMRFDGLEAYRKNARKFTDEQQQEIRSLYEGGALYAELLERFGGSYDSIKKAIKRAGGSLRGNPIPLIKPGELESIRTMYEGGASMLAISIALGRSLPFVRTHMDQNGIARRALASGPDHHRWKGGEHLKEGYVLVRLQIGDPFYEMTSWNGDVPKHRLVMARHLGRVLTSTETVHHINGDKQDNRIDNLQLRQGRHGKGAAHRCLDCGSVNITAIPLAEVEIGD